MKLKPSDFDWEKYDYFLTTDHKHEYLGSENSALRWLPPDLGCGFALARTPKPKPIYQLLTPGMEIREGDEWYSGYPDKWSPKWDLGGTQRKVMPSELWRRELPEGTKLP